MFLTVTEVFVPTVPVPVPEPVDVKYANAPPATPRTSPADAVTATTRFLLLNSFIIVMLLEE